MVKQRDVLKGRVKRILKDDKDMGQVSEQALQGFVSALESFVRDIGTRMTAQAKEKDLHVLTPIELKRAVQTSDDMAFLHDKVASIDESDVKYHKAQQRKRAAATKSTTGGAPSKRAKKSATSSAKTVAAGTEKTAAKASLSKTTSKAAATTAIPAVTIAEDDNYDESDDSDE